MTLTIDTATYGGRDDLASAAAFGLRVTASFAEAEAVWRALEADAVFSAYQRFDWADCFHTTLGEGSTPCLAILSDAAGRPQALLPLAISGTNGLSVARFIGGKHCNFGLGLWRPAFAQACTPALLQDALEAIARQAPRRIDLFSLTGQPTSWAGLDNPLHRLAHQPSPSFGYHLALGPDPEATLAAAMSGPARKKLRKKEKALAAHGTVAFVKAETRDQVETFTDAFLAQKAQRCRELGIPNAFAEPDARDFILTAATRGLAEGRPVIELYALTVAGEPVATFGGTVANGRFSGMFNAMTAGPMTRESPGEILLSHLIRHCCLAGLAVFDLGAGKARYKSSLCDGEDMLFDQFIPITWRGQAAAAAYGAAMRMKRAIKQSDRLWPLVQALRRARGQARA
ncbi:MAG: GNAT family N-acetyltransferase [Rhizobiales bacterium]|nr:GNAT family N-acetyltransferase [Hyphomicrobiales bacterium]